MKILDLKDGPINQRHYDQVAYKAVSPREDIMHGEEVVNSLQTIEDVEEDGKGMEKLKKMELSNKELGETGQTRMKYHLQPIKYPRLSQRAGLAQTKKAETYREEKGNQYLILHSLLIFPTQPSFIIRCLHNII